MTGVTVVTLPSGVGSSCSWIDEQPELMEAKEGKEYYEIASYIVVEYNIPKRGRLSISLPDELVDTPLVPEEDRYR